MIKIKGLDSLQKTLAEAQKALESVDGELGTLSFDPNDPESIEAAIIESERLVDDRLSAYTKNPIVRSLIDQLKESFRNSVIEKAASARLGEGNTNDE